MMERFLGVITGVVVFSCLELFLYSILRRRQKNGKALESREMASRLNELLASVVIVGSGVLLSWTYIAENLNGISAVFPAARWHTVLMLSFFLFHAARVLVIPGYLRSLLLHHGLMIVGLSYCLTVEIFYFYPAIISLQSLAAILRNYVWLSHRLTTLPKLPRHWKRSAYIFIENILTLSYLVYFLGWGMHVAEIPWHGWAVGFLIAMILLCLTLYWTMQFLKTGGAAVCSPSKTDAADASAA